MSKLEEISSKICELFSVEEEQFQESSSPEIEDTEV